jgi:hypothetical protein
VPQIQLPIFPAGSTAITSELAFEQRDGQVCYFNGHLPVFIHGVDDTASFRFFTSQLIAAGTASQGQISRTFGVPLITVKRMCKKLREQGAAAFYRPSPPVTGHRLTPELIAKAQALLDEGRQVPAIGKELGVRPNTIHKAISHGRLKKEPVATDPDEAAPAAEAPPAPAAASSQSERSKADGEAVFGVGTTREMDRLAAALGLLDAADLRFEPADDIPNGGVLCALPALLALGLLRHTDEHFSLPKGFYPLQSIFVLLASLALARVPSLEQLRYEPPGEWGKLMGLDRIPEVKTLREKIGLLADDTERTARWAATMARDWMGQDTEAAGVLLIDGHTRVYHGKLTKLPRRYVARERLCLRATTDYWVNALDGQPFFCVTKPIDPGLQKTIRDDLVPRLLLEVPGQPTEAELAANPLLPRFTLVFDREGYSPDLIEWLWTTHRIAILTYHKHPGPDWDAAEFGPRQVILANGEEVTLLLAERGTLLPNDFWLREIRKLDETGHQTAILTTRYLGRIEPLAAAMFARWHQENFFKYMRQHYGLDRLVEHGTSPIPDTTRLVNPAWRALDSQVRSITARLTRQRAQFGAGVLDPADDTPLAAARHEQRQGEHLDTIFGLEAELATRQAARKQLPKHITLKDLPEGQRFAQLRGGRKLFIDTIKLIAYRAETALVELAREVMKRCGDGRSLIRGLIHTSANLRPDPAAGILNVELHGQSNPVHDTIVASVCEELNATETIYPGTDLRLIFTPIRSSPFPAGQDV